MNKIMLCKFISISLLLLCNIRTFAAPNTFTEAEIKNSFIELFGNEALKKVCEKANALTFSFSVRSLEGEYCSIPIVAAYTEIVCKGIDDFEKSHCHKKALLTFKDGNPIEYINRTIKLAGKTGIPNASGLRTIAETICLKIIAKIPPNLQTSICPWPKGYDLKKASGQ